MQTYRTLLVVQESGEIVLSNLPFRPGQLVEVLVLAEERERDVLAQELAVLFKETQSLPQIQPLSEAEIEAEIAAHRSGQ